MPAKENSRAWVWALQQNIMGLNFKTYPTLTLIVTEDPNSPQNAKWFSSK